MSAFGTFAICLTTAYALYYTVTILLDLKKKGKEKTNDSVETFELRNVPDAPGKVVEETEGGFRVAKEAAAAGGQPADPRTHPVHKKRTPSCSGLPCEEGRTDIS